MSYSYDSRKLLSYLVNPQNERTTWQYDSAGRPTTMTYANQAIAETDYDSGGRSTAVRNLKSDRTVISVFTYTYDNAGNRTTVAESSGDRVTWSYDNSYQLTREQRSGANAYDVTYSYDAVGNRLTKLEGGTTTSYTCDNANQLSVEYTPSARTTYTYDANGNTSAINAAGSRTTYTWDLENHITTVQLPGGSRNTYTYDGQGKRRQRQDSEGTRNLIWDLQNILGELDGSNSTVAAYTLAPKPYGNPISQRRSGATSFHHFDALGSTDRLTDSAQGALASYLYRAFGEQSVLSGSATNPFTWVGRLGYYRQADTSDFWVRARVYRPTTGRWVSRDPLRLELNFSRYAVNRPVLLVDPSGYQTESRCVSQYHACWQSNKATLDSCYEDAKHESFDCLGGCVVEGILGLIPGAGLVLDFAKFDLQTLLNLTMLVRQIKQGIIQELASTAGKYQGLLSRVRTVTRACVIPGWWDLVAFGICVAGCTAGWFYQHYLCDRLDRQLEMDCGSQFRHCLVRTGEMPPYPIPWMNTLRRR